MEYQIDKSIPMPQRTRIAKYPFAEMSVGDSFLVPVDFEELLPKTLRRMTAAKTIASANLRKSRDDKTAFIVSEVPEGVRVWRKL